MEREYVRGNKEHWRDVWEWAYGGSLKEEDVEAGLDASGSCFGSDMCIFLKESEHKPLIIDAVIDKGLYDAITTNPHWHEVRPWEDKPYEPKPFDKVLGWKDDNPFDIYADIFLHKHKCSETNKIVYTCAFGGYWEHVKPYNEEEYLKSLDDGCK